MSQPAMGGMSNMGGSPAPAASATGGDSNFGEFFTDDSNGQLDQEEDQTGLAKKQSVILIAAGVIGIIVVVAIAAIIANKSSKKNQTASTNYTTTTTTNSNQNVDNIMNSGNSYSNSTSSTTTSQSTVITNTKDSNFTWSEITDSESINFNESYSDMTFTITQIQHKARVVDTNGNLVVKTTLLGSISGLPGTYELDIPYNKGIKLVVGNSFTVHVQLGSYNGKTVVGEVTY
jgi:gas vesicle protein